MITGSSILKELEKGNHADPQTNSDPTLFAVDFLEWSLDPKFFAQVRHCFGVSVLALHGNLQFLNREDSKVVDALRHYKKLLGLLDDFMEVSRNGP